MGKPLHVLPELRFPNRLEGARRVGVEIVRSVGQVGRPATAEFRGFRIQYFTPFNQPRLWVGIDWSSNHVRLFLSGLTISDDRGRCLNILWDKNEQHVRSFRDPSVDDWDRQLRRWWRKFTASI
jgi:hypothetical protein